MIFFPTNAGRPIFGTEQGGKDLTYRSLSLNSMVCVCVRLPHTVLLNTSNQSSKAATGQYCTFN